MGKTSAREPADLWLFSYGTLRQPEVQHATFGRRLEGERDTLRGYAISLVAITDPDVIATSGSNRHPIIRWTGNDADEIEGEALALTASELAAADRYEVSDYRRIAIVLKSGRAAFVYVTAEH